MFQTHAAYQAGSAVGAGRIAFFSAEPGLIGRRLLAAAAAAAFVAAVATLPHRQTVASDAPAWAHPVMVQADNVSDLRDQAESLRARLLATPGVGAVAMVGLRQTRLAVDYTPSHLAGFGITPAQLQASLPVDVARSRPGRLALQADDHGMVAAADMPVRSGTRVFRLGDVAMVERERLDPPVSTMAVQGRPAVLLDVTMAK